MCKVNQPDLEQRSYHASVMHVLGLILYGSYHSLDSCGLSDLPWNIRDLTSVSCLQKLCLYVNLWCNSSLEKHIRFPFVCRIRYMVTRVSLSQKYFQEFKDRVIFCGWLASD